MANINTHSSPLEANTVDYVTAGAKAALGLVPFAGSLLAEIAGSVIPRQRVDRIVDFTKLLEARISNLEQRHIANAMNNEDFTDLTEEALRQASRATTPERREYLANLLGNSLSSDAISYAETKHLMRLMGELNDVEIIWLRFFANPTIGGDETFRNTHENILKPRRAYIGASKDEIEANALQESYKKHLVRLGLVDENIQKDRDGNPKFDTFSGDFKISYRQTSPLGDLLLRQIGLWPDEEKKDHEALW